MGCSRIGVLWKATSIKVYQSLPSQQKMLQKQWTALKLNRRTGFTRIVKATKAWVLPGKWLPSVEFSSLEVSTRCL